MNRRYFLKQTAMSALAVVAYGLGATKVKQPNILFVYIDDMGFADPSCFGNPKMKTPNIDKLASEGVRLTNFYSNSPICSPSRVSALTGQYPHRWKIFSYMENRANNARRHMADYLSTEAPTTARALKRDGYKTAHFGKWHVGGGRDVDDAPLPQEYGFDESLVSFEGLGDRLIYNNDGLSNASAKLGQGNLIRTPKHKGTQHYVERSLKFMEESVEAGKPFYIELFPNDVHDAHLPAPGTVKEWVTVADNPWERKFFAVLKEMDKQLGRAFDKVKELGIEDNTFIVFTSDNGPTDWPHYYNSGWTPPGYTGGFYGRKWSLYEGGIRMPFIAKWKGRIEAGRVNEDAFCAAIDLSPTFCNAADVKLLPSEKKDGQDIMVALQCKDFKREKPVFWQYGDPYATLMPGNKDYISPSFAMRDQDWKLLIKPDGSDVKLFNIVKDREEEHNLTEEFPEKVGMMKMQLKAWAKEVGIDEAVKF
ncbi:MAG: sulfatase-like hydrolase/transferase [Phycisphaerae bacterium]